MNAATPTFNSSWQPTNPLLLWLTARGLIAASAGQHDWVLLNTANSKAIFSIPLYRSRVREGKVVHQGNYDDGSSRGMEGCALDLAIQ